MKESGPQRSMDDFDKEEETDRKISEDIRRERHAEKVAEILGQPQKIMVGNKDIAILKSAGDVILSGVELYGRKLAEGEKIILVDENMQEIEAEFVSNERGIFTKKIKVRLPGSKPL